MTQVFQCLNKIPLYIYTYFSAAQGANNKKREAKKRRGRRPNVTGAAAVPKLSPTDQHWMPALLASVSRRGGPLARLPELFLGVGECPEWATYPGRPGQQKSPRPSVIVTWPRWHTHRQSCPCAHGPCPAPPIGPVRWEDACHAPDPLLVSPPTPPGLFPTGGEGSSVPLVSNQGQ
jgi:hypothetical protein